MDGAGASVWAAAQTPLKTPEKAAGDGRFIAFIR